MNATRWKQLMSEPDDEKAILTHEEMAEGWHWCGDMDGLLANSNDPNGDCFCELQEKL